MAMLDMGFSEKVHVSDSEIARFFCKDLDEKKINFLLDILSENEKDSLIKMLLFNENDIEYFVYDLSDTDIEIIGDFLADQYFVEFRKYMEEI